MQQEIAREPSSGNAEVQVSRVPFSSLGHQSGLFLDYQRDPVSLRRFYPNAYLSPADLQPYVDGMLASYKTDRNRLCDALFNFNTTINLGEDSRRNIESLRDAGTVAVLTGQQAGLFTGPLYTIYKALSAIKAAELLSERGVKAVPVFWIASEDHDFKEVSETSSIDAAGTVRTYDYVPENYVENIPVGRVEIDNIIDRIIDKIVGDLDQTAFTPDIERMLRASWVNGVAFSNAFARNLADVLNGFGMVFIDPLHPQIKELSAPIYKEAIINADEMVNAVIARSRELVSSGYHGQVEIHDDYFPLFWHDDTGARRALRKVRDGVYRVKGEKWEFELNELAEIASKEPARFSPGVMLRPVVQDYLLPTACYFGGGAEIAYFAQNSEVYKVLGRPVTPIFHRQSFTVIESKQRRTLEKFSLELPDLFLGLEELLLKIAERSISTDTAKLFADVEEEINVQLHKLDQRLAVIDPSLAESLGKRRRKIIYHIGALRRKALRSEIRRHEDTERRIKALLSVLLPHGQLQERTLNFFSLANKFGPSFIHRLYNAIDLEDKQHRIVYL